MPPAEEDLQTYYSRRAPEYDAIYSRPERQHDLLVLERLIADRLAGASVLEIACGTGYWTERIAASARSVLATDKSESMLEVARRRPYPSRVTFQVADAFAPVSIAGPEFDACFAGFWWSHIPRRRSRAFVQALGARLRPGARCIFIDSRYVPGNSTPVAAEDTAGDTYQDRVLRDGSTYRVLKNFPSEEELRSTLGADVERVEFIGLEYFWCLIYRSPGSGADTPVPVSGSA